MTEKAKKLKRLLGDNVWVNERGDRIAFLDDDGVGYAFYEIIKVERDRGCNCRNLWDPDCPKCYIPF